MVKYYPQKEFERAVSSDNDTIGRLDLSLTGMMMVTPSPPSKEREVQSRERTSQSSVLSKLSHEWEARVESSLMTGSRDWSAKSLL